MAIKKIIFTFLAIMPSLFISIYSNNVIAEEEDEKKACRLPRLRSITPKHLSEVPPETEFSFTLPQWTDPEKVTVSVKKLPTEYTVENHNSFLRVKGKIPASIENSYARVSVKAIAFEGCVMKDGWLLKVTARTTAPIAEDKPAVEIESAQDAKLIQ